jgi:hypothetical protein
MNYIFTTVGKPPRQYTYRCHISLDIDSIDPLYVLATETYVPDGMLYLYVIFFIEIANTHSIKKKHTLILQNYIKKLMIIRITRSIHII